VAKISSATGDRISLTLESTLDSVNLAESVIEKFASECGVNGDELQEVMMSVREATVNAVLHGNAYDPAKRVEVVFGRQPGKLQVTVRDQGKGFDEEDVPDPLVPENLLKQSGRGIFLMRAYMDEVRVRNMNPGTEVILVKNTHARSSEAGGKERV